VTDATVSNVSVCWSKHFWWSFKTPQFSLWHISTWCHDRQLELLLGNIKYTTSLNWHVLILLIVLVLFYTWIKVQVIHFKATFIVTVHGIRNLVTVTFKGTLNKSRGLQYRFNFNISTCTKMQDEYNCITILALMQNLDPPKFCHYNCIFANI